MTSMIDNTVNAVREQLVEKPQEPEDWLKASEVEEIAPDEEAKTRQIADIMKRMMQKNFDAHGHYYRGTHVKSLGFVKGTMTVRTDLPPHLQQGIFQPGKTYPVIARYANEPSYVLPDTTPAPRGMGVKIFDVSGDRLSDDGLQTQDFLFNNAPMVELTDVRTTLEVMELREEYFDDKATLAKEIAKRSDAAKQLAPTMLPNTYVIGSTMYSQSAFAFGPYVAKFSLEPTSPAQKAVSSQTIPSDAPPTFHRNHLRSYYTTSEATYSFRVQFASNLKLHPVEDASVPWDEVTAPWHDVATITFPAQETLSEDRRIWWEDKIRLSPWDGVTAHKPLGGINRLRKGVYERTQARRGEGNRQEVKFPASVDEMPA